MDVTTARPTLLNAAKNFIRKSAGTAVLAIAPLAAVILAPEAKAQAVFGLPYSGGSLDQGSSNSGHFSGGSYTASAYLENGIRVRRTTSYVTDGAFMSGSLSIGLGDHGSINPTLDIGSSVDFTYDFDISVQPAITFSSWYLQARLSDGFPQDQYVTLAYGTAVGNQTGSGSFTSTYFAEKYELMLFVYFDSTGFGQVFIGMDGGSQGVTLNATAIPEPSTYAALFGLGALGFVVLRRSRRVAA